MVQQVSTNTGATLRTTRCPIRLDGRILTSGRGAPKVGEHNEEILDSMRMAEDCK